MNIQINCTDSVEKEELLYIFYNLQDWLNEYKEKENQYFDYKYINGKQKYYKKLNGNWSISTDMELTCNGKTMYLKINNKKK